MARSAPLKRYINALHDAFDQSDSAPEVMAVARKVFKALQVEEGLPGTARPQRLPVCSYFNEATAPAEQASPSLSELASAFSGVEPQIHWNVRPNGGPNASDNWLANHANGVIFGPGGIEERTDVMIGASLLAPNVRYPDHNHPPEEIYLVLTPGRFQHGASDWFTPGVGGTLHNVPFIKHAMASEETPLLAIWCLLLKP